MTDAVLASARREGVTRDQIRALRAAVALRVCHGAVFDADGLLKRYHAPAGYDVGRSYAWIETLREVVTGESELMEQRYRRAALVPLYRSAVYVADHGIGKPADPAKRYAAVWGPAIEPVRPLLAIIKPGDRLSAQWLCRCGSADMLAAGFCYDTARLTLTRPRSRRESLTWSVVLGTKSAHLGMENDGFVKVVCDEA